MGTSVGFYGYCWQDIALKMLLVWASVNSKNTVLPEPFDGLRTGFVEVSSPTKSTTYQRNPSTSSGRTEFIKVT
jgi:hypothetical protein